MTVTVKQADNMKRCKRSEIKPIRYFDPLTGLANAHLVKTDIEHAIIEAKQTNSSFAIMFINLNRFNVINNIGGYETGDYVLKDVTSRILKCLDETSILARWHSDNFICLLPQATKGSVTTLCKSISEKLAKPINADGHQFKLTTSIGTCFYPENGEHVNQLITYAEAAMNQAKRQEMNEPFFYRSSMNGHSL